MLPVVVHRKPAATPNHPIPWMESGSPSG